MAHKVIANFRQSMEPANRKTILLSKLFIRLGFVVIMYVGEELEVELWRIDSLAMISVTGRQEEEETEIVCEIW